MMDPQTVRRIFFTDTGLDPCSLGKSWTRQRTQWFPTIQESTFDASCTIADMHPGWLHSGLEHGMGCELSSNSHAGDV